MGDEGVMHYRRVLRGQKSKRVGYTTVRKVRDVTILSSHPLPRLTDISQVLMLDPMRHNWYLLTTFKEGESVSTRSNGRYDRVGWCQRC